MSVCGIINESTKVKLKKATITHSHICTHHPNALLLYNIYNSNKKKHTHSCLRVCIFSQSYLKTKKAGISEWKWMDKQTDIWEIPAKILRVLALNHKNVYRWFFSLTPELLLWSYLMDQKKKEEWRTNCWFRFFPFIFFKHTHTHTHTMHKR